MARKNEKAKLPESSWLDTYADTITLLMTFFVLLYSMSSVDAKKFESIASALNSVLTGHSADSILEYDVQENSKEIQSAINQHNVSLVPTVIYINKNGKVVNRTEGYVSQSDLEKCFNELLK